MKQFLILIGVLVSLNVDAQNWLWTESSQLGGGNGYGIATDLNQNVYVGGPFWNYEIQFGQILINSEATTNIFLTKYDKHGTAVWGTTGVSPYSMILGLANDNFGFIYAVGHFSDSLELPPHGIISNSYPDGVFVAKYDSMGNVLWLKKIEGWFSEKPIVSSDSVGNITVAGNFGSPSAIFDSSILYNGASNSLYNGYLAHYNSQGTLKWVLGTHGTYNEVITDVHADNDGNIYVTGLFQSPFITFGQDTLYNYGLAKTFLTKLDSNGIMVWSITDISGWGTGKTITTDKYNNVYLTGIFSDIMTFGSDTTFGSTELTSMFICKYDYNGQRLWSKSVVGAEPYSFVAAPNGNFFVSGKVSCYTGEWGCPYPANISFDSLLLPILNPNDPMFVSSFNSDGSVACATVLRTGGNNSNHIVLDSDTTIYLTGTYWSPPFIIGNDTLTYNPLASLCEIFVTKYHCGEFSTIISNVNYNHASADFIFYPNPTSSSIQLQLPNNIKNYSVKIYNTLGQLLIESKNEQTLDVKFLETGLYIIQLQTDQVTYTEKFIKQ